MKVCARLRTVVEVKAHFRAVCVYDLGRNRLDFGVLCSCLGLLISYGDYHRVSLYINTMILFGSMERLNDC